MPQERTISRLLPNILLTLLSALFVTLSFPNTSLYLLAWIAFIPLLIVCTRTSPARAFLYGLLFSLTATYIIFRGLLEVSSFTILHFFLLAIYLSLYPAIWCFILAIYKKKTSLFVIIAPTLWVAFDYFKSHLGFLSIPSNTLAHSQASFLPIIQIAAFTGEYGVTFLIILVNAGLTHFLLTRKKSQILICGVIFLLVFCYGSLQLMQQEKSETLRVASIQPARPPRPPHTGPGNLENFTALKKLTLVSTQHKPDLIIWPESLISNWYNEPAIVTGIYTLSSEIGIPLVIGVTDKHKEQVEDAASRDKAEIVLHPQNSAYFISPSGDVLGPYTKHILFPFSEYTPLAGYITWPSWITTKSGGLEPGKQRVNFLFKTDITLVPLICWENYFSDFIRKSITGKKYILIQLVNDNLFQLSPMAAQHNTASVFRAVENRTPVVISSNTGPSQIIDSKGKIIAEVGELYKTGVAVGNISPGSRKTFYNTFGDIFVIISCLLFLATILKDLLYNNQKEGNA